MTALSPAARFLSLLAVVIPGGFVALGLYLLAEKLLTTAEGRRKRLEARRLSRIVAEAGAAQGTRYARTLRAGGWRR